MREMTMETFHIINQIPKNLIPVKTGLIETYLDGLHLEIYGRSFKISLETFERSFRRGEKTEISREASSDI